MALEVLTALEQLRVVGSLSLPPLDQVPRLMVREEGKVPYVMTRQEYYEMSMREVGFGLVNLLRADVLQSHREFDRSVYYGDP